jgi:cell fate (sporulation/competence/biofilm development) regulator YlbF (YheA/YmcA/DUF963 family)
METTLTNELVTRKTEELCETILAQPAFSALRKQIDTFLSDESAKSQYRLVVEKGEFLNHKQHQGVAVSDGEIAEFERQRQALVENPVARDFLSAQEAMHRLQESVGQYLTKTFELGRVPTADDMGSGSCGSGCGCHH